MKTLKIILILLFFSCSIYGQQVRLMGTDCNPKLNKTEILHFEKLFPNDNFDFTNKTIGFATPNIVKIFGLIDFAGFNTSLLPIDKKEYFKLTAEDVHQKNISKLLVLTNNQKEVTKGFDAIIILIPKKKSHKVSLKTAEKVSITFSYRDYNYPDNLDLLGVDSNSVLNTNDVIFFNRIFQYRRDSFDFTGKKIAFINTNEADERQIIKAKSVYIDKIKKHLENDFLYPTDFLYILNDTEKQESGGYDAIILYRCKMFNSKKLIAILKQNGT